jgi:CelD/BcsL family acetyltransferase involved in cellulose biosynthesis
MPFGTYGGPVTISDDASLPLLREFKKISSRFGVVKVGWIDFAGGDHHEEWIRAVCETHLVDISVGFKALWAEKIERQRKKRTRRAERLGVTIRRMQAPEDIDRYYTVYSRRLEQWGVTDKYPQNLFSELLGRGGDSVRLYLAFHEDEFLGGHVNLYFKNMVTSWNGITSVESNRFQPATLLYIHCMKEACEEGFSVYNLGGSLGKRSLIDFKESLGGVPYRYIQFERRSLVGKLAAGIKRIGG